MAGSYFTYNILKLMISLFSFRKRWLLFPPTEDLKPTRIPYEESSIYSKINLFSPSLKDVKSKLKKQSKKLHVDT